MCLKRLVIVVFHRQRILIEGVIWLLLNVVFQKADPIRTHAGFGNQQIERIFVVISYITMQITLTTPALLFPAISLLLLAYTNRFLAIANIIRQLHKMYLDNPQSVLKGQIENLRLRLHLIKAMQFAGVGSLTLCVLSMFFIYLQIGQWGSVVFGISLGTLLLSLVLSLIEIQKSTKALDIELSDMALGGKTNFKYELFGNRKRS